MRPTRIRDKIMHINDFKKQIGMNQGKMKINDFKSQSGMKIRNDFFKVYCTKCGMLSPARVPTKCPMGGFHLWMNIP